MDVLRSLLECGARQQGLATARQLQLAGVARSSLSRATARGQVTRVRPGVYSFLPLPEWPVHVVTHEGVSPQYVQHVRAVLLSLGEGAAAGGTAAACLRGWGLLHEPVRTLDVVVPRGRSRTRLARVRPIQRRRARCEALVVGGADTEPLLATSAVETVLDCCRSLSLLDAVVVCDSALRSAQLTLRQLRQAAARLRGHRHAARVRQVLGLCDPDSGSVLESVLRVRMVQGGITGFSTQRVILNDAGRHILRVDFCFEAARLVVETDGSRWHPDPSRDRRLDNRLVAAGWRVLRFTWAEVVHDPEAVLGLIRTALAAGTGDCHLQPVPSLAA